MPTVTSELEIVNMALVRLGDYGISSMPAVAGDGKPGRFANLYYAPVRDALLRSHPWNFAVKRASLASSATDTPEFEYEYTYPLPSDFLKMIRTYAESEGFEDDYRIEHGTDGTVLRSHDDADVEIEYIARVTDVSRFDPIFVQCLALNLAAAMCMALADNANLLMAIKEELKEITPAARTTDAQEGTPRAMMADPWVTARA
jgi:hypothetical protein